MEVDPPPASSSSITSASSGSLKRSNSAPMINALCSPTSSASPVPSPSPSVSSEHGATAGLSAHSSQLSQSTTNLYSSLHTSGSKPMEISRIRRYSASYTSGLHSPTGVKGTSRLDQIKLEESISQKDLREVAHERERISEMQMSTSWEGFSLQDERMMTDSTHRPKSFGEPLHILTSPYPFSSSPSPTRVGKQCFSPSLQQPIKSNALTPSPSPSPTRKTFVRRSLSPIAVRPSPLSGIKRKVDDDLCKMDTCSPAKRPSCGWITPEKLHLNRPLLMPMTHSPEQQVPMSLATSCSSSSSSTLTVPSSTSVSGMPCFFRPVRDSIEGGTTDNEEVSDMTESNPESRRPQQAPAESAAFHTPMKQSPDHV